MSTGPVHDLAAPRKEKPKMKQLLTYEPLSHDREKKPPATAPRKRKRVTPTTPALSFDPKRYNIPSGKQDTPVFPPTLPRPSVPESPTSPYDEQQTTPFADRDIPVPYEGYGPYIFSEHSSAEPSASSYHSTPYTDDVNSAPPDPYDSPASHTSSSSDQSTCPTDFAAGVDYERQAQSSMPMPMCSYDPPIYVQPVIQQVSYGYPMDPGPERPVQSYPVQYMDSTYGRPGLHGGPAYPGNHGYYAPPRRY